jgi:hypothetical protein
VGDGQRKNITNSLMVCAYYNCLGLKMFGKDWKQIEDFIGTRTGSQIRSHAQKYFNKVQKPSKKLRQKYSNPLMELPLQSCDVFSMSSTSEKYFHARFPQMSGPEEDLFPHHC